LVTAVSVVSEQSGARLLELIEALVERWGEHHELLEAADKVPRTSQWDQFIYQDFDPPMTTPLYSLHNLIVIRQLAAMRAAAVGSGVTDAEIDAFQLKVWDMGADIRGPLTVEGLKSLWNPGEQGMTDTELETLVAAVSADRSKTADQSSPPLPTFPPNLDAGRGQLSD
jgi:hypothetical protein